VAAAFAATRPYTPPRSLGLRPSPRPRVRTRIRGLMAPTLGPTWPRCSPGRTARTS